jgi:hypothetical protein
MGHVWLARDEETGLDVALKMVAREGKAGHRAEREARAAAALRHPRCQRIYALARDSGHVYIAYEYIPGRTLRQAVVAGELGDTGAVEAAVQVLEALAHAHGRGIVHRDVKPSNVLLAEGDGVDVRLVDFGLAQMAEFDTLTAKGDVPGTLAYVSPERLLGEEATPAADVWAVGVMLWESLAGRHPFRCDDVAETSRRIQTGAPPLESVRPDLPRGLCAAVAAALVLNPARRPPAARLAADLRPAQRKKRPASRPAPRLDAPALLRERVLPAALAGVWTGAAASLLPFYPAGWPLALAAGVGAVAAAAPRAGLALALAVPVFPLGNVSLGLALAYGAVALAWLFIHWRDPRNGLLLVAGPLLAPLGLLPLVPLAVQTARGPVRKALQAAAAVGLAAVVAGLRHERLPLALVKAPLGLGITGSRSVTAVATALERSASAHPALVAAGIAFAVAGVALSQLRGRGLWPAALAGAGFLAAVAAAAPRTAYLPVALAAWAYAAAIALRSRRSQA